MNDKDLIHLLSNNRKEEYIQYYINREKYFQERYKKLKPVIEELIDTQFDSYFDCLDYEILQEFMAYTAKRITDEYELRICEIPFEEQNPKTIIKTLQGILSWIYNVLRKE